MTVDVMVGVDLGTQGVRAVAVDHRGALVAAVKEQLPPSGEGLPPGWHEQDPEAWWGAVSACLQRLTASLPVRSTVGGIAVDSTSGTILPVDARGRPLHPALMYNDARSWGLVPQVRAAGASLESRLGYTFDASFALPKILWLARNRPEVFVQSERVVHAADFIVGRLCGDYGVSDYSNALKSGFDLLEGRWPAFIQRELGIPIARLPSVVAPGTPVARIDGQGAAATGLPAGTPVLAGATDGVAAHIASGAVEPGAWNSSLGTTLIVKGITERLIIDPEGRIYSHRHPEGWWMPGGASNTGAEWIEWEFPGRDHAELDAQAAARLPTGLVRYPLVRRGERFPFRRQDAEGFTVGHPADALEHYAAGLEGLACLERLAYDTLEAIGVPVGPRVHATGGGSRSDVWLRVRASVLGRAIVRPKIAEAAMGAALLAASGVWFGRLSEAVRAMVTTEVVVEPEAGLQDAYQHTYRAFLAELRRRGYLSKGAGDSSCPPMRSSTS